MISNYISFTGCLTAEELLSTFFQNRKPQCLRVRLFKIPKQTVSKAIKNFKSLRIAVTNQIEEKNRNCKDRKSPEDN